MDDRTRDVVELVGQGLLEAAVGLVPFVGPVLGVAASKSFAAAEAARTVRLIGELRGELERAIESGKLSDPVAAVSTDQFGANVRKVVRASEETASLNRRRRLRQALVVGMQDHWVDDAERFIDLIARLGEEHVTLLESVEGATSNLRSRAVGLSVMYREFASRWPEKVSERYPRALALELAAMNLVDVVEDLTFDESMTERDDADRFTQIGDNAVEAVETVELTPLGRRFLTFLGDEE